MQQKTCIIIGAGVSGLMAAKIIAPYFKVIILEAQDRIGGRIHTLWKEGQVVEAGASFVHGDLPVTMALLNEANIHYIKASGELYRKKEGILSPVEEMTEGWDIMMEKMNQVNADINMQEFLDRYFDGPGYTPLRNQVRSFTEGFDLADLNRVSVKALYQEWSEGDDTNYHIPGGYAQLVQYLQDQLVAFEVNILIGTIVRKVKWQPGLVTVQTKNGHTYTADKLLVSVPASILQGKSAEAQILFEPALPFGDQPFNEIGFGPVIKVVLKFKVRFWPKDTGFILSDDLFPTWWTALPDETFILTGWLGGPRALALSGEPDEVVTEKSIHSLAATFDLPLNQVKEWLVWGEVYNWQANPFILGGYSYAAMGSDQARQLITKPVDDTLFFCGEAFYNGAHPGTVEAALVSGVNAATHLVTGV